MVIVQKMFPLSVNAGGSVKVSGSGFDSSCGVLFGDVPASIVDYNSESLEFVAPGDAGSYDVTVTQNGTAVATFRLCVVPLQDSETWNLPVRGNDEFRNALLGLMPRGFAWFTEKLGNWWKLFTAFGAGFLAVYDLLRNLVKEMSPATTESYTAWENELGLPLKGIEPADNAGRLAEIYRVARKQGGCTVPYFLSIASLFGVAVKIYEYFRNPEKFSDVDFGDDDPNFYWKVNIDTDDDCYHVCTCEDPCDSFLEWWWNAPLEAIFDLLKPAHTKIVFGYYGFLVRRYLITDEGKRIVTSDGKQLIAMVRTEG